MKRLPGYLQEHRLAQLQRCVTELNRLSQQVSSFLPEELAPLCHVVRHDLQQDVLVISCSEHGFLTQLRFLRPHLLQQLRYHTPFKQLKSIEVVFTPKAPGPNQPNNPTVQLSTEARQACHNAAAMCKHPGLQEALQRLAGTSPADHT